MKLASYRYDGLESFGMVVGDAIIDLKQRLEIPDLKTLLGLGVHLAHQCTDAEPDYGLSDVELMPPIPNPAHIIGVGLNTKSHAREASDYFKTDIVEPKYPRLFLRASTSHVAHGQAVVVPTASPTLDYEGEMAIIIGRGGRYIPKADALDHIAGIACYNDGSIRAYQLHSEQVTPGKNFYKSGSFGPWITTLDEAGPVSNLVLETRVNGELRQRLTMDDLYFDFASLIEYASQPFHLQPGDVIIAGSSAGVGAFTGRYLVPGDELVISIPTAGILRNTVVAEG
ncbi:4-hydroxyphenylacetate degradation bifunctional isomerase/decarboxylase [Achromobacter insolitus]|uniref:fumarylacetoacetate hydrolase family protein n=1 Tax=Achromobacter insolitus TaxID=217204 RepID=UPI000972834A|nr:fumarylacetoacetate hydrolase family protein [Achromobacter insolitus]APX75596.1 hypothetical protein BUW96_12405 [Achromobacter insolitus]OWT59766.1 5-carboxymethyl-2-hydroxymuconate isomerase [Achromobacter insolitus]CAB3704031.1 putative protein YisK [Achromobacter insolitus]VEG67176.1 4-hydroxyphenylacetate degradation bifunctional isomerase/decarboxylase [Achromobacter insolitus]